MKTAIVVRLLALIALPATALAQTPVQLPPPSYGTTYLTGGPVDSFEMRRFRDWQMTITVAVPTPEVMAVLPDRYTLSNPGAPNTGIAIAFVLHERLELLTPIEGFQPGSYKPVDEVLVIVSAMNPAGVAEFVVLENLRSTPEGVAVTNAVFGAGSARLADMMRMEITAEPDGQTYRFKADVVAGPLQIGADATFSPAAMTSLRQRLTPVFRYVDKTTSGSTGNRGARAGAGLDTVMINLANVNFKRDRIRLSQGTLTVVGPPTVARVDRWQEIAQKIVPKPQ